jgi:hypothetical protein
MRENNTEMDVSPIRYEVERCLELAHDCNEKQVLVLAGRNFYVVLPERQLKYFK